MKKKNVYVVRKIVYANSVQEAIRKEKKTQICDIVLALSEKQQQIMPRIGFEPSNILEEQHDH